MHKKSFNKIQYKGMDGNSLNLIKKYKKLTANVIHSGEN